MFGLRKPREHALFIGDVGPVAITAGETVLNGALRNGIDFPHSCRVGGCGSCKCELVSGKVRELTDNAYLLSPEELRANYILGCQSIPVTDVVVRLPANAHGSQRVDGYVAGHTALTHDITEVRVILDQPVRYLPGQYASVEAPGTGLPARCYSFARAAPEAGIQEVSFFVRSVPGGRMSGWLSDERSMLRRVRLQAGLGSFHLRDGKGAMTCVAGGSGLAPVFALLEGALDTPACRRPVNLLMGARTRQDLYLLKEIDVLRQCWQAPFHFIPVLSEEPEESDWKGLRGWVTEALTPETAGPGMQGYLCGPPPMIDACAGIMHAHGLDDIHFDKFSDQGKRTA